MYRRPRPLRGRRRPVPVVGAWTHSLTTSSTTDAFIVLSGWIPAIQADQVMAAFVARNLLGNFQFRLCYRTATTSKEDPNGWSTTFDSWHTAGELNSGNLTLSIGSHMWVQFGIQYSLSSGSSLGQATITTALAIARG